MKILIAGQFNQWALEKHYLRYLSQHAEVVAYPAEDIFDDYYWSSTLNKVIFRLGLSAINKKISAGLIAKTKLEKPDIVWVFKGMRILPQALKALRQMGVRLANYNGDDPFFFYGPGSGNKNVAQSIGLYDLHFSYHRGICRRIEHEYGIRTAYLPFAYELPEETYQVIKDTPETLRACFIGNPDKIRANYLQTLARSGVAVDVYGVNWHRYLQVNATIALHPPIFGEDFWRNMRRYRLQVNIFRPHNEGSHNMRTFEVPAAGGIMLAPDSAEHREFFHPGVEFFSYRTLEEMVEQAKRILELPAAEAACIRESARGRSLASGYSYEHRVQLAVEALRPLLRGKRHFTTGLHPF